MLPESEVVIIKPNWYSPNPGNFTKASIMEHIIKTLDRRIVVIEGYSLDRQNGSMKFRVNGEDVNWNWLKDHGWQWIKTPRYWDMLETQDEWFLEKHGFKDLFNEYDIEYINVSEEIWKGRTVEPSVVEKHVSEKFGELTFEKIYGFMPEKLYRLRGAPLISLGKIKGAKGSYPSLSVKNLFGLIPDPLRVWWHGPGNRRLDESILDIMRLYASFFTLYGVCDGVEEITVVDPVGDLKFPWGNFKIMKNPGIISFGKNLLELDSLLCSLIGVDPSQVGYLKAADEQPDSDHVKISRQLSKLWLKL